MKLEPLHSSAAYWSVRALRNEDVPSIARIEIVNFHEPKSATAFYGLVGQCYPRSVFVATVDWPGEVIGYVASDMLADCAVIRSIAVDPHFWGRRFGRNLINFVCNRWAGNKPVEISVPETRLPIQRLLVDCGFRCYATIDRYYSDDSNAFVFRKAKQPVKYFGHCESTDLDRPRPRTAPGNR